MTFEKASVPAPLKLRLTTHSPVVAPVEVVLRPAWASEMSAPSTSTGPSRNFSVRSWSHVMSGTSEGAAFVPASSTWSQLKASNCSCSSGVTQARSDPSVGVAVGVAVGAGVSVASSAGASDAPSLGSSVGDTLELAGPPASSTARNSILAEALMRLSVV